MILTLNWGALAYNHLAIISLNKQKEVMTPVEIKKVIVSIHNSVSAGSGVLISADGLIATNYHVIKRGNTKINFVKYNSKIYSYKIIHINKPADLALIKIEVKTEVKFARIALLKDFDQGEEVYAIGNPLGEDRFITKGIISKLTFQSNHIYIGTDAAMNPGNSGGGLFLKDGRLIGITSYTKMRGKERHSTGMGFALSTIYFEEFVK